MSNYTSSTAIRDKGNE
ncbi:hypothetical protein V5G28_035155 [Scytonema sp. PRP1]